jgi:hypothetical protein
MGTPVWSHGGIVCTGETYKNVRRAIDIHEGDKVDEAALEGSHPCCGGAQSRGQEQTEVAGPGQHLLETKFS